MDSIFRTFLIFLLFACITLPVFSQSDTDISDSGIGSAGEIEVEFDVPVEEILADFDMVWKTINDEYVDPGYGGINWEALRDGYRERIETADGAVSAYEILAELVTELGNRMTYVVPPWFRPQTAATSDDDDEIELEYAGVGILLQQMQSGEVWVMQVFRGTPAEASGVLVGDTIAGVNEWRVEGDNAVSEISTRVRGPVGTNVSITLRSPDGSERDVAITRAKIDLRPSVEYRQVEGSIGYLRVPALTEDLVAEASKALPRLLNTRYLLLDLRNVASGTLDGMTQIAQWFLGSAQIGGFVSRDGAVPLPFRQDSIAAYQRPMAILVNSGTYGVGEMLAKILRDYKRGPLIGNQTQGGFQIGRIVDLPSGGALQMTIGLFVTPASELLPIDGLTPDTIVEIPELEVIRSGRDVYIESAVEVVRSSPRL